MSERVRDRSRAAAFETPEAGAPIVLELHGGSEFVIEPVSRVLFSQSFAKCGATDGSSTADTMGKRRVLMSLARVRWLERPDPCQ